MENHVSLNFLETMLYNHEQWLHSMKCLDVDVKKQIVEIERVKNIKRDIKAIKAIKSNKHSKDD
ncbi:hypothetical protein E5E09_04115 [Helicobacter pylori]|nr:hypothetical protein [Helicobacter pylori]WRG83545.1 hypothetical protein E5E09_04115 [Helicobacter pylori]